MLENFLLTQHYFSLHSSFDTTFSFRHRSFFFCESLMVISSYLTSASCFRLQKILAPSSDKSLPGFHTGTARIDFSINALLFFRTPPTRSRHRQYITMKPLNARMYLSRKASGIWGLERGGSLPVDARWLHRQRISVPVEFTNGINGVWMFHMWNCTSLRFQRELSHLAIVKEMICVCIYSHNGTEKYATRRNSPFQATKQSRNVM